MQKVISILGVISSMLFAVAPQFSSLQPKTAAWLILVGTVATSASGALIKFGNGNIYITVTGVAVAVLGVLAGAGDMIPEQISFAIGVAGTALAALGKSLFGWGDDSSDDDSSIFKGNGLPVILIGLLAIGATQTACTSDKEYAKTLDRVSGYVGSGLALVDRQTSTGEMSKETGYVIANSLNQINELNGQLITESKKYISPYGQKLQLTVDGKTKILTLLASSQKIANDLVSNPTFAAIPDAKRQQYVILINDLTGTIAALAELVNAVKGVK